MTKDYKNIIHPKQTENKLWNLGLALVAVGLIFLFLRSIGIIINIW